MTVKLQVALDRMALDRAVRVAEAVAPYADWVEVGTSLIKEFGMSSVRAVVAASAGTQVLADTKTNDNARYEFDLAYGAGAAAATVMATAPDATVDTCFAVARERGATVMVDLLAADPRRVATLVPRHPDGIFALHVSKDQQQAGAGPAALTVPAELSGRRWAIAGGIGLDDLGRLPVSGGGDVTVIVGSAVTGSRDPGGQARRFADALRSGARS